MDYFAHIDGERKQSVLEHSEGVARLAGMFAGEFGKYEWGYCSGMLHDIGKYSLRFQRTTKGILLTDHMYRHVTGIADRLYVMADGQAYPCENDEDLVRRGYLNHL